MEEQAKYNSGGNTSAPEPEYWLHIHDEESGYPCTAINPMGFLSVPEAEAMFMEFFGFGYIGILRGNEGPECAFRKVLF